MNSYKVLLTGFALLLATGSVAMGQTPGNPPVQSGPAQDATNLLQLLLEKKFALLNEKILGAETEYERDFKTENRVTSALIDFEIANPNIEPLLDEWTSKFPQSFQPFLCRGAYFYTRGARARGGGLAADTLTPQFESMEYYFRKASADLTKSLELRPAQVHPYAYLIRIAARVSDNEQKKEFLEKAVRNNPYTIIARQYYLRLSTPRWGGSLEGMESLLKGIDPYLLNYPEMKILEAEIDLELAYQAAVEENNRKKAIELYGRAISRGDSAYSYSMRGHTFMVSKEYDKAIADFDKVIQLNHSHIDAYSNRFHCKMNRNDYPGALADLNRLIELEPKTILYHQRAALYDHFQKYDEAIQDLEAAIRMNQREPVFKLLMASVLGKRGTSYIQNGKIDLALSDFDKAIEIAPGVASAHFGRGYVYDLLGRAKEAIADYSRAIELDPKSAAGYVNRGAIYYKIRDRDNACRDWKKACELGSCASADQAKKKGYCDDGELQERSVPGRAISFQSSSAP